MSIDRLASMRSLLFVPGDRPERFGKALASAADGVIVDLEDAVATDAKEMARIEISRWLADNAQTRLIVRTNAADTPDHPRDLDICRAPQVLAVMLPKAEAAGQVQALTAATGKPILPLIESARGLAEVRSIAAADGVVRLCLGTIDLALDLGLDNRSDGAATFLDHARVDMAMASRLMQRAGPVDGVYTRLDDEAGLAAAARHASGFGFTGMLAIHPRQTDAINAAFAPAQDEVAWAEAVLAAAAGQPGAFSFRGGMVDAPVLARARKVLSRSKGRG